MAQPEMPSSAQLENPPPGDPFAIPLTVTGLEHEPENQEEWEYEYSTTETETYYVTLDLTTPNVPPKRRAKRNAGRGGSSAKWLNPGLGRGKRTTNLGVPIKYNPVEADDEAKTPEAANETPRARADKDEYAPAPGTPEDSESREEDSNVQRGEVQILDLHSKNPIVSYDGYVYSCKWVSDIGTEFLFTERDIENPLPALRHLPGDVDLLAASSARIISNSVIVEPKRESRSEVASVSRRGDARGCDPTISIPVGVGASQRRKDQARFLERLIQIKEEKGEEDQVTIITQTRLLSSGWRKHLNAKRAQEKASLKRTIKTAKNKERVQKAKEKLQEMEREDAERELKEKMNGKKVETKAERRGRKMKQKVGGGMIPTTTGMTPIRLRGMKELEEDEEFEMAIEDEESLSMATPNRWQDDEDDVEEGEGFYEDEENGDEDAPGEDEDTQMTYGWS